MVVPVLFLVAATASAPQPKPSLDLGSTLRIATVDEGRAQLGRRDEFVASLSAFDRSARLKTAQPVTEKEYLSFVGAQVLAPTEDEKKQLLAAIEKVRGWLAGRKLKLPGEVLLIETTGQEEGDAPYTRGIAVVLPRGAVGKPPDELAGILAHELFHVMTRSNPSLREDLYAKIGFSRCGTLELPKELRAAKITNPDAPALAYATRATVAGHEESFVPVLFARSPYDEVRKGEFFEYLAFAMLQVDSRGTNCIPVSTPQGPVLMSFEGLPGVGDRVGRNTNYVIHPEEILADNFVLLLRGKRDVPSPEILDKMAAVLWPSGSPKTQ